MINRTKIKDSIYDILDEDPKKIQEYIDNEAKKTSEQKEKEKEKRNKRSNIVDINLQENIDNQPDNPYNKIVIHTEKDNLVHNYFHYFDMYWDAGDCMSSAILKLPKTNTENTKYWITYTGDVTIYLGNEINTEMHKSQDQNVQNTYFDLQGMKPIFKGEIGRIKEYNKELEIHVDSIGKRFKQKIPEDFRQSFIYNQNVRDAFQAICEFLGVKYICPPGKPPEQDNQTPEEATTNGDGTENNVNDKNNQEQQISQQASAAADQASKAADAAAKKAADKMSNSSQNNANTGTDSNTSDSNNSNNATQNNLNDTTQQNDIQNGLSDISFDANGGIVHGSSSIITSPDMEDTLLSLEEHPLDSYLEDTTFVATDVKKFLKGEMFDTVHSSVMNYGSITIQPKSSTSSDMSTVGSGVGGTSDDQNSDKQNDGSSGSESQWYENGKTGVTLKNVKFNTPKQALSYDQVNAMSFGQAQQEAAKTDKYYWTTILRLRARGALYRVGPGTPYYKFNY